MLKIDGSLGEGGGQILRSSLALSLISGRSFTLEKIRANRSKGGLLRQHLTAVRAAQAIGAKVEGAELGSRKIVVHPEAIQPGQYDFAVGSAGSACLVLQTVLPPLLVASGPSRLVLEGGTHNPWAPPFDFLERAFLPALRRMGAHVEARLDRYGFYPAGGGRFTVDISPTEKIRPMELLERGPIRARRGRILVSNLPRRIGRREAEVVRERLRWEQDELSVEEVNNSQGPGNVIVLEMESEGVREVCCGFGERGVLAETVAVRAAEEAHRYIKADVPVGIRLADQLMIPIAMAGAGRFKTLPLSGHSRTNMEIVQQFLPVRMELTQETEKSVTVAVSRTP